MTSPRAQTLIPSPTSKFMCSPLFITRVVSNRCARILYLLNETSLLAIAHDSSPPLLLHQFDSSHHDCSLRVCDMSRRGSIAHRLQDDVIIPGFPGCSINTVVVGLILVFWYALPAHSPSRALCVACPFVLPPLRPRTLALSAYIASSFYSPRFTVLVSSFRRRLTTDSHRLPNFRLPRIVALEPAPRA